MIDISKDYQTIDLRDKVGHGYKQFWKSRHPIIVLKGSRASKKSTTVAMRMIYNIMKYPESNALIIRRFYNTNRDSTFAQLKWAVKRLEVEHLWKFKNNPFEAIYKPTGQRILFRGFDKPDSLTSITVDSGYLCWVWIEEAYQIESEEAFNKLETSIRGKLPPHLWKQIILTFNPWSSKTWIKKRFFDQHDSDVLTLTTDYRCNEWIDDADRRKFDKMRIRNPRRFQVEGRGEWGVAEGLIYENWKVEDFDITKLAKERDHNGNYVYRDRYGMDFGWTNPTALVAMYVSPAKRKIYIFDEICKTHLTNDRLIRMLYDKGYAKRRIVADSEDPKTISYLKSKGVRIEKAKKGRDSVRNGIVKLQDYEIIVHPKCQNVIVELSSYAWDSKNGIQKDVPIKEMDHTMDAMRYAVEDLGINTWSW